METFISIYVPVVGIIYFINLLLYMLFNKRLSVNNRNTWFVVTILSSIFVLLATALILGLHDRSGL